MVFFKIPSKSRKVRPKSWWVQLGLFFPTPIFIVLDNYAKSDFCTFCKKKVIFSINGQKYHSYAFFHEGGPRFSSSSVNLATFQVYWKKFYSHFLTSETQKIFRYSEKSRFLSFPILPFGLINPFLGLPTNHSWHTIVSTRLPYARPYLDEFKNAKKSH